MIELIGVGFDYVDTEGRKRKLLKDITFSIQKGERVVLFGINGSGKSTLMKILNALLFAQKGEYRYKKQVITKKSIKKISKSFRKEVVFLMQNPDYILFNPTVYEELAFGPKAFEMENVEEKIERIAKLFGIEDLLSYPPHRLSGGEKQKVALASLLILEPEVLLLDEPTAHLDPFSTGWLVDLLYELQITSIVTTHNLSLASELGERALVLAPDHQLLYDGDIDGFLKDFSLLKKAGLVHCHRHKHGYKEHIHYHIHNWEG